jgi:hypothetical protein
MTTGNIFEQTTMPAIRKNGAYDREEDAKDTGVLSSETKSQEIKKKELILSLIGIIKMIRDEKEKPKLDLANQEMIIHGTFIENIESLLRNGFDDSLSKRQFSGYGEVFDAESAGPIYAWEQPYGGGLYFTKINGKTSHKINYEYSKLENLFDIIKNKIQWEKICSQLKEEKNLRSKYEISQHEVLNEKSRSLKRLEAILDPSEFEEVKRSLLAFQKNRDPYTKNIRIAIKKYANEYKGDKDSLVIIDRNLTVGDFIDESGTPKEQSFRSRNGKEIKFFYDKDGWMKVWRDIEFDNKKFTWKKITFANNYPIHMIVDPKYFSQCPAYEENIRYAGDPIPPESIKGIVVTLDISDYAPSSSDEFFDLTRKSYIPERNRGTREPKEIKREVLIRFLIKLVKKIKREKPEFEMPIYDEQGRLLFST